jgi:hypothetical protein
MWHHCLAEADAHDLRRLIYAQARQLDVCAQKHHRYVEHISGSPEPKMNGEPLHYQVASPEIPPATGWQWAH